MPLIRKDEIGLYVSAGGHIFRPLRDSEFKSGDRPTTKHFGGTCVAVQVDTRYKRDKIKNED